MYTGTVTSFVHVCIIYITQVDFDLGFCAARVTYVQGTYVDETSVLTDFAKTVAMNVF